jgi:hypothetical protein
MTIRFSKSNLKHFTKAEAIRSLASASECGYRSQCNVPEGRILWPKQPRCIIPRDWGNRGSGESPMDEEKR